MRNPRYDCTDCENKDVDVDSDMRCTNCGSGRTMIVGWDLSDGVETHVEGHMKDGVLHITDSYEIIDQERHKNSE